MSFILPIIHTYPMNSASRMPPSTRLATKLFAPEFSTSRDTNTGIRKKITIPRTSDTPSRVAMATFDSCASPSGFSSVEASLADIVSDFIPTSSVSRRTRTPRSNAMFRSGEFAQLSSGIDRLMIRPSGRRTARAARLCPRIITPSMIACPPYKTGRFFTSGC